MLHFADRIIVPRIELVGGELRRFMYRSPFLTIILPAEDDMLVSLLKEPAVANGDAVGVVREIGQDQKPEDIQATGVSRRKSSCTAGVVKETGPASTNSEISSSEIV